MIVAVMALFVAEPDRAHAQALSADASLSGLTVVGGPGTTDVGLAPSFSGGLTDTNRMFTARIPFTDTGVVITPTATENDNEDTATNTIDPALNSIIRVNGTVVVTGMPHNVSLAGRAGRTSTITIVVTAPQRTVTETYTVKVYRNRQTLSDNANLASLSVSGGSLTPRFSPGTSSYTARVQADTTTISYRLSDTGGGASVGDIETDGSVTVDQAKKEVPLGVEATTTEITVTVTAEDGSPKPYTIDVYRVRANRDTNANLATLELEPVGGARVTGAGFTLDTTADDGITTNYKDRMNNATTHVTVAATASDVGGATVAISPSDARPGADDDTGHQVALRAGAETTIRITVTAEDTARRQIYTIKVYRERATPSDDNNLNSLRLSAGTLTPAFNRNREPQTYTAQVADDVQKVTVSYAASDTAGGSAVEVASTDDNEITNNEVDLEAAGNSTNITVTVTPESGTPVKVYTITVYRLRALPSADASLRGITVTPAGAGTLDPVFAATTKMYNVNVEHNISAITVAAAATTADMGAIVAITPSGGDNVSLAAGAKTRITITVTAEDRATRDTYTVYVYRDRATQSDDATLSALSLSAGALSPAFMSDTIEYKSRVANDVDKVTVSSTPNDNAGGASVAVNPSVDTDCSDDTEHVSGDVSLSAGGNTYICVTATAEDDSTKTYMITVYRLRANANPDASLNTFTIAEATGTININDGTITNPADTLVLLDSQGPDVPYRVRQVTVVATADIGAIVTIMPADADPGKMGHQVDLAVGAETSIAVEVMPEDSAAPSKTYTAIVYRKNVPGSESDDATLSSLMLSGAALTPAFASSTMEYTAAAARSTEMTTVTAMATHIGAQSTTNIGTMSGETFAPVPDADMEMDGWQVALTAGQDNVIAVQVMAEDDTAMETYTVTVNVAAEASSVATLSALSLSDITLDPAFDPATTDYTAEVANDVDMTTVTATATSPFATVSGDGAMPLSVGANTIMVTVTAEDDTEQIYTVIVTRAASADATLSALSLSDITLVPEFMSDTMSYTAEVANDVHMTTVTATAAHSEATVSGDVGENALEAGANTIEVTVTAEDGTTMMTYTVMVTRDDVLTDEARLLAAYDMDSSGHIDLSEVSAAIDDYFDDILDLDEVSIVIDLYFE